VSRECSTPGLPAAAGRAAHGVAARALSDRAVLRCAVLLVRCTVQAAMEVLFLEAAMQVFEEFVPEFWQEQPFQGFFKSMQQ
jgi:hypothetical protein